MRLLIASTLLAFAAPAAAERIVVVGATGPSSGLFPRGQVLDERRTVTLQPLDRVIVVDTGGTRVFSGPGPINFGRGTASPSRWEDIRSLVGRTRDSFRRKGRARAGAMRGGVRAAGPPEEVWAIEWPAGGSFCFDAEAGMLIHAEPGAFQFTDIASRKSESGDFAAGQTHLEWPPALLPDAGKEATYSVRSGGVTTSITLAAVPVRTLDPLALADYVTSRRCEYPLSMFADKADQLEAR